MGALIAAAGMAGDALTPLRTWTVRQVWRLSGMASREKWRERTWRAALEGIEPPEEPDWGLDSAEASAARATVSASREAQFRAQREQYDAATRDPDGRKFPGTL